MINEEKLKVTAIFTYIHMYLPCNIFLKDTCMIERCLNRFIGVMV